MLADVTQAGTTGGGLREPSEMTAGRRMGPGDGGMAWTTQGATEAWILRSLLGSALITPCIVSLSNSLKCLHRVEYKNGKIITGFLIKLLQEICDITPADSGCCSPISRPPMMWLCDHPGGVMGNMAGERGNLLAFISQRVTWTTD